MPYAICYQNGKLPYKTCESACCAVSERSRATNINTQTRCWSLDKRTYIHVRTAERTSTRREQNMKTPSKRIEIYKGSMGNELPDSSEEMRRLWSLSGFARLSVSKVVSSHFKYRLLGWRSRGRPGRTTRACICR